MYILFIIGASQAFFLFLLSLKSKENKAGNMLSILLLAFALHLLLYGLSNTSSQFATIGSLRSAFPLLYGPSLFLYIQFQTLGYPNRKISHYLHFIPFFLFFACISVLLFFYRTTSLDLYDLAFYNWGRTIVISSFAFYGIASFKSLKNHKLQILRNFSYTEKIDLKWLYLLLLSLIFIWGTIVILVFVNKLSQIIDKETEKTIIYCILCVYVFFIGFNGIKQSAIVSIIKRNETFSIKYTPEEQIKDNEQIYFDRIKQLVEEEKLYLNPKLSIKDLAERLKTNINYISRAINNKTNNNFFDFVNKYRVKEFERLVILPEKANFTLLAIAMECGFNSKASFNRIIKGTTGHTPIELKNKLLHNLRS